MHPWQKGPRPKTAATWQQAKKEPRRQAAALFKEGEDNHKLHLRVELRTAITSGKRKNAQQDPTWDLQREYRETSSRNFKWVTKYQELDVVESSAPSEAEKEAALA
jgi:hypothetical protein